MYKNFEISLAVFMPNITTNHAITYTNFLFMTVYLALKRASKTNTSLIALLNSDRVHAEQCNKIKFELSSDNHEIQSFMSNHNNSRLHYFKNVTQ